MAGGTQESSMAKKKTKAEAEAMILGKRPVKGAGRE
jgi:hypothetical protein